MIIKTTNLKKDYLKLKIWNISDEKYFLLPFITIFLFYGCDEIKKEDSLPISGNKEISLRIFYTNDEHGWMEGVDPGRGAAECLNLWQNQNTESDITLMLSGGDNWTGQQGNNIISKYIFNPC